MIIWIIFFLSLFFVVLGGGFYLWLSLLFSTLTTSTFLLEDSPQLSFKYIIIQEVLSVLFLTSYFSFELVFSWVFLFSKLGMPPVHFWFVSLLSQMDKSSCWALSFGKLVPLFVLLSMPSKGTVFILLISLVLTLFLVYLNSSFKSVIFYSGCLNLLWGGLVGEESFFLSLIFIAGYISLVWLTLEPSLFLKGVEWTSVLSLSGLPPSLMFFLKFSIALNLSSSYFLVFLVFFCSTIIMTFSYFLVWERGGKYLMSEKGYFNFPLLFFLFLFC